MERSPPRLDETRGAAMALVKVRWEYAMQGERTLDEVLVAVRRLQESRASCVVLKPSYARLSQDELAQRARIIDTVVRTRKLLQSLQTREDELGGTAVAARLHQAESLVRGW